MTRTMLAILASGTWISLSEFARNELLFKSYWLEKYGSLGLQFPSEPLNGALWVVWSFLLAASIAVLSSKLRMLEAVATAWVMAFAMMWLVIGNLNVLPLGLLVFAIPLSIVEVTVAAFMSAKIIGKREH